MIGHVFHLPVEWRCERVPEDPPAGFRTTSAALAPPRLSASFLLRASIDAGELRRGRREQPRELLRRAPGAGRRACRAARRGSAASRASRSRPRRAPCPSSTPPRSSNTSCSLAKSTSILASATGSPNDERERGRALEVLRDRRDARALGGAAQQRVLHHAVLAARRASRAASRAARSPLRRRGRGSRRRTRWSRGRTSPCSSATCSSFCASCQHRRSSSGRLAVSTDDGSMRMPGPIVVEIVIFFM